MPRYTLHAYPNEGAYWLIEPEEDHWRLWMKVPGGIDIRAGIFNFPHEAAQAVAEFKTGDEMWDLLRAAKPEFARSWEHQGHHDLKTWRRHDA
jgi:hypothetical protein